MKIQVLLADDHRMFREGLRVLLEAEEDIEVVGEASNSEEVIQQTRSLKPNIVVMDINMPGVNGLNATHRLVQEDPNVKVVILSMWLDDELVRQAMNVGVSGYVVKQTAASELITAIREVQKGNAFFSPSVSKVLLKFQGQSHLGKRPSLTYREYEVLQLITEGKSSKEIGEVLLISTKTIEKYRQQIMDKLNIHDVASLTRYALTNGLVK